jgi:hypothetical protein
MPNCRALDEFRRALTPSKASGVLQGRAKVIAEKPAVRMGKPETVQDACGSHKQAEGIQSMKTPSTNGDNHTHRFD